MLKLCSVHTYIHTVHAVYTSSASAGFLASSLLVISFTRSDCTSARRDWKLDRSSLHTYIHTIAMKARITTTVVTLSEYIRTQKSAYMHSYINTYCTYIHTCNFCTYTRHSTGPHATTLALRTSFVMSARSPKNS